MVEEGKKLAALHPNIVVKVPMIVEGVKAIKWFTDNGIKTNCTLVFSAGQAILAAKAGATMVSPFIGRLDDAGKVAVLRRVLSFDRVFHGADHAVAIDHGGPDVQAEAGQTRPEKLAPIQIGHWPAAARLAPP